LAPAPSDRAAGDRTALTSEGLAPVLDLEVAEHVRSAAPDQGGEGSHQTNLAPESTLGNERIRGGLLKLGIVVSNRSIRRYRWRRLGPAGSQNWRTFLSNQLRGIWAADLFVVQTLTFRTLYVFFFIRHERRELIHFTSPRVRPRLGSGTSS
jgi:hypothetical protein